MRDIIIMTREIYHCYMKEDGSLYENPIGSIGKRNLTRDRDLFLRRYIDLIMNTKIVNETTKMYIQSSLPSVASVIKNHNDGVSQLEEINIKTAQSKIDYDGKKLLKYFTNDMLNKIIGSNCDIDQYIKMLNLAVFEYKKHNKLLDNIDLNLPKVPIVDSLTDDELDEILKMISPFIKSHKRYIEENLPFRALGYLYYLASSPDLYSEAKRHYNKLKELLE